MKKIILLLLTSMSLMAWDCATKDKSTTLAKLTGGKSAELYCRNIIVLLTADYSDRARIQIGYGYSQADDDTQREFAKVIMEQSEQCYNTCLYSLNSLRK